MADEDGPAIPINVTGNDLDPDASDDLEIVSVNTTGTVGTVTINAYKDSVTYDPNGEFEHLAAGETRRSRNHPHRHDGDAGDGDDQSGQ
jgi:hypothetical protein